MTNTNERKHTPGPWEACDDSITTEDICIAVIETDGGYEAPYEQRKANAALISAAPDMFEALKEMMEIDSLMRQMINLEIAGATLAASQVKSEIAVIKNRAHSALAKATTIKE